MSKNYDDELDLNPNSYGNITQISITNLTDILGKEFKEDEKDECFLLTISPYIASFIIAIIILWSGGYVFQLIDEVAAEKPLYVAVFYTFQVCCAIGWGDMVATNPVSQIYTIFLTLIGAPFMFAALSNIGKLFDRDYAPHWLYLTRVVRKKTHITVNMPVIRALNFLLLHTFIVCIINTEWIQNIGVINSIYYIITTDATVGIGDYLPNPRNLFESICCQIYLVFGIILATYWFNCCAHYYQQFYFVTLRNGLFFLYKKFHRFSRRKPIVEKIVQRF